ncbi:hypothetical protein TMatcc_007359 [Talaromyces marneffei ATCC 18224]|uniref:Glc8 protein n=2 Tax=Talaromyces marneffei TaxID=37727 RepID=B6QFP3_TALMQ|nr:conserved hypothetical protein [Talaromyces marneffei ATCC 18224]EEA24279.1 conserved hypothetical protein [Talaromyces marneffei ATCC 18224]KAE8553210.1 hypothetical protein EYB25_004592 [Talaromyces marneffei]
MTLSHETTARPHSPEDVLKRPKGILKKSSSFIHQHSTSPEKVAISPPPLSVDAEENKEITLQNTLQNAGRRSSSTRRASAGRRLSGTGSAYGDQDDRSTHLKWDEANLYLAEQEKTAKMKIDEPKTPWAPSYDPAQDEREDMEIEAEDRTLDAQDLVVDELDQVNSARQKKATGPVHDNEIPDLELGEPEEDIHAQQNLAAAAGGNRITRERSLSQTSNRSDKHVDVVVDDEESGGHGEGLMTTEEAKEKHRQFEEHRKRHYEMRNIKDILAHPEEADEMDDDDDEAEPPAVPKIPKNVS